MILWASSPIAERPSVKLPPECAARPVMLNWMNTLPLRPFTTLPLARPGSPFEHHAGAAGRTLDNRARGR